MLARDRRGIIDRLDRALNLAAPDGIQNPVYPLGAAESQIILGRYYLGKCNYSKALQAFRIAAQLSRLAGSTHHEILCQSYLSLISGLMADPSQALQFSQEALRSAQMLQDPLLEAEVLIHFCYLEILCDDPAQAIKTLESSLQILRAQQDSSLLGKALEIQGQAYLKVGEGEKALHCLQECLLLEGAEQQTANLLRWKKIIGDI
jgi:tetratricopeptide (TPR) repeat protein